MKQFIMIALAAVLLCNASAANAEVVVIDFDGLATTTTRSFRSVYAGETLYTEDGFLFDDSSATSSIVGSSDSAYTGSAAVLAEGYAPFISRVGGGKFDLLSIDFFPYAYVQGEPAAETSIFGFRSDGTAIGFVLLPSMTGTRSFSDLRFTDLDGLLIVGGGAYQFGNIRLGVEDGTSAVPEPAS